MTQCLYPQNLKAVANIWLWSLREFAILGVSVLLSIVLLVQFQLLLLAVATLCFGFLTIWILSNMRCAIFQKSLLIYNTAITALEQIAESTMFIDEDFC